MQVKERQTITPRLNIELHKKLKIHCVRHGITIEDFVIDAIKEKLEREDDNGRKKTAIKENTL